MIEQVEFGFNLLYIEVQKYASAFVTLPEMCRHF